MRIGQNSIIAFLSDFLSTILGFVSTILIARFLGADVLGIYGLFVSVVIFTASICSSGFNIAIKKRISEPGDSGKILTAGFVSELVLFLFFALLAWIFRSAIEQYLRGVSVEILIGIVAVSMLSGLVTSVLDGEGSVHISSLLRPVETVVRSSLQIVLILTGFGLTALIISYLIALSVSSLIGIYFISIRAQVPSRESFTSIFSFAKYSWISNLRNRAFSSMDILILGFFVSEGLIGIYKAAWNVSLILGLFSNAVSRAIFPQVSQIANADPRKAKQLVQNALPYAGFLIIPGLLGGAVIGKQVLALYSPEFTIGYNILLLLILAQLLYSFSTILETGINAFDKPEVSFRINGLFIVANFILNILLIPIFGWVGAALATFSSGAISLLGYWHVSREIMPVSFPKRDVFLQLISALLMAIVVFLFEQLVPQGEIYTVVIAGIGSVCYFGALMTLSPSFRVIVRSNLPI
ncbi:oligosaccharide flippase family protein [Haloferax sp. MBLA0076]|uniref:Oligosaccharide flippase family protein n=1 Tax=Haloferax litoreum TaxID=2666140 RepID=A0A6A8GI08_9EURY|nr:MULTISPECIES: oligosaccharide flippase family protein [Haloferax]KAB1194262.1 oligosaccharide flippase family protein [Haloferax sp. CBA1148]MRX22823.1 oligosaccharide flippase family protein [Haloferax litoreum]